MLIAYFMRIFSEIPIICGCSIEHQKNGNRNLRIDASLDYFYFRSLLRMNFYLISKP